MSKGAVVGEGKRGILQSRSGIGIFGVAVLAIFRSVFRFFGFCAKIFGFSVLLLISVCGFYAFWHLVFGFRQKHKQVCRNFFPVCLRSERLNWSDAVQC